MNYVNFGPYFVYEVTGNRFSKHLVHVRLCIVHTYLLCPIVAPIISALAINLVILTTVYRGTFKLPRAAVQERVIQLRSCRKIAPTAKCLFLKLHFAACMPSAIAFCADGWRVNSALLLGKQAKFALNNVVRATFLVYVCPSFMQLFDHIEGIRLLKVISSTELTCKLAPFRTKLRVPNDTKSFV